jgi:hypothetical protein
MRYADEMIPTTGLAKNLARYLQCANTCEVPIRVDSGCSTSITDLDTGTAETNQNRLYTHFNRAGERIHEAKSPTGLVPPAIRLCYPLDLSIWGRQRDNFKITRAESTPTGYRIHLAHSQEITRHGTLTMDAATGLLTRWITYRDNRSIADYELTSIVRPAHR